MSAKTKIVVLHMKEVIYTGVFIALGLLLIVLLVTMFLPSDPESEQGADGAADVSKAEETSSSSLYLPGIYTTELVLGGETVDVEVIVTQDYISSIQLKNLSDSVATMYPLLTPTFEDICEQIFETQSVDSIAYTSDNKYTSLVLVEAIRHSLEKASAEGQKSK